MQKIDGATYRLYGGCRTTVHPMFSIAAEVVVLTWGRALSC